MNNVIIKIYYVTTKRAPMLNYVVPNLSAMDMNLFNDNSYFDTENYITIIHADDDTDDKELVVTILNELKVPYKLLSVSNGEQLLDLLEGRNKVSQNSNPDVIISDMNMPRVNGFEVLQRIKNDLELSDIPVYIFSTSFNKQDIEITKMLGAAGYFHKTSEYSQWKKTISEICSGTMLRKTSLSA